MKFNPELLQAAIKASPRLERQIAKMAADAVRSAPRKEKVETVATGDLRLQILTFEADARDGLFDDQNQTPLRFVGRPQVPFRGERLIAFSTDPTVPLEITQISVGKDPQLVNAGGGSIPLDVFRSDAVGVRLQLPPARVGNEITIEVAPVVTLVAGQSTVVRIVLLGTSVD